VKDDQRVIAAANALTSRWITASVDGRHSVLSGLSAWVALAYLAAAAEGPAEDELTDAVGLRGADAAHAAADMIEALRRSPATSGASALWLAQDVVLTSWWENTVGATGIQRLSGDHAADNALIGRWVSDATRGLISESPVTVDQETRLLLLAAIAVDTTWTASFEPSTLSPTAGPWRRRHLTALDRTTHDRNIVTVVGEGTEAVTVVRVEGSDDVDVYLALGHPDRPAGEVLVVGLETASGLRTGRRGAQVLDAPGPGIEIGIFSSDSEPVVALSLPKFAVDSDHDLLERAAVFGLDAARTPRHGHFPRLAEEELLVGEAKQTAVAEFSALGFKAAAVTAIGLMATGIPDVDPESFAVTFDRPFGFVAVRRDLGLVLVAGWVAEAEDFDPGADHELG
jgi:serine protease inhibitor